MLANTDWIIFLSKVQQKKYSLQHMGYLGQPPAGLPCRPCLPNAEATLTCVRKYILDQGSQKHSMKHPLHIPRSPSATQCINSRGWQLDPPVSIRIAYKHYCSRCISHYIISKHEILFCGWLSSIINRILTIVKLWLKWLNIVDFNSERLVTIIDHWSTIIYHH